MTKLKNHSSAKKRFKATGSGLKMRSSGRNHILSKHSTKKKRHARGTSNLEGANLKKYLALVAISDRSTTKLEEMIEAARSSQLFESTVNNSKDQVQSIKKEISKMKRSLRDLLSEEVITIELDLGETAEVDSSEIEVKVVEEEEILDASAEEEGDDEEGDEEVAVDVDVEAEEEVDLSELVNEVEEDMDEMYGGNRGDDHRSGKGMHHISGGGKYGKGGHRLDYMEEDEDMDEGSYMEEEEDADEGMDHMMEGVDDDTVLEIDENMLREELAKLMQESEDSEEEEVLEETAEPVATEQNDELQAEIESYQSAVTDLQSQLAEMSLFNAKLLYTNKLLMNSDLSQTQRAQAIETLDDAASLREVKLLFKTLTESFSKRAEGKTSSRNIGGASRPTSSASMNLNESRESTEANRWALLAGIK